MNLSTIIRDVPDFPKPGILFKDITPLLGHPEAFAYVIEQLRARYADQNISKVIGIESRGFIFGAPLAVALGVGFVPIRKPGKLPAKVISQTYELEYGTDRVEIHEDSIAKGERVVLIDDVVATGGTLAAAWNLIEQVGGTVVESAVIIELTFLPYKDKLGDRPLFSLVKF